MTEQEQADALLKLIEICGNGAVRPYDHSHFLYQLKKAKIEYIGHEDAAKCCPPSTEVRDAKDFKPYMLAALDKLAEILNLEVKFK